ncbi:MAG: hypothetical protein ABIU20_07230 [Blastocatellia bacterium]
MAVTLADHECGAGQARRYQIITLTRPGELSNESEVMLCARCARAERRRLSELSPSPDKTDGPSEITRAELIAELDQFFAASGVFDICGRCHQQGTGCCPPTCRVMGTAGCDPNNKRGKTVFCAAFVCSALLNAISECNPEAGRTLRWVKRELGLAEFHIYEMITRVPAEARETVRPLTLPKRYPRPEGLRNAGEIRQKLAALTDEVLALRRQWHELEKREKH